MEGASCPDSEYNYKILCYNQHIDNKEKEE